MMDKGELARAKLEYLALLRELRDGAVADRERSDIAERIKRVADDLERVLGIS